MALLVSVAASVVTIGCDEECVDGVCEPVYGYYYDSLVSGVTFESTSEDGPTQTGVTGEDDDPGRFRYLEGDTVSFSLGDTSLGQSTAQERVTPFDLAGVDEAPIGGCDVDEALPEGDDPFRLVHNLAVLLQTLDTDGDPTGGIEISAEVAALFEGVDVELDQSWDDFQNDTDLQAVIDQANEQELFSDTRTLLAREEALRALYQGIGLCN
jgi:hypothetical protein